MISIKKFLAPSSEAEHTLMHVVRILVEGLGQHSVAGEAEDQARFRQAIRQVSDALAEEISPAELLVHAGSVLSALEEHNRRATSRMRLQTLELQNMVKMLTSTVGVISAAGNANISRLGEIEQQVAVASELDDVLMIKGRLSDCLADIRREAERQRKETGDTIQQLTQGLDQARNQSTSVPQLRTHDQDILTGLPLRPEAEAALAQPVPPGSQAFAAVLVLDRLQLLNARFGRTVGDEILVEFTRMVQKQLTPEDRLFRWTGSALLALLPRTNNIERVRSEFGRIMATKLEHSIETPSRSILLPVVARWALFPTMAAPRLLYQKIDAFAAAPVSRD